MVYERNPHGTLSMKKSVTFQYIVGKKAQQVTPALEFSSTLYESMTGGVSSVCM
jgi:hypothetical protein